MGIRQPLLWLNPHWSVHLVGGVNESAVVYDITDDWTSLTQAPWLAEMTAKEDAVLCRRADATIVCSERLWEMKAGIAKKLFLVPNGVDAQHYAKVLDSTMPLPSECMKWPKPVFGYTGTIHPDRVDVNLIEAIAQAMCCGSIVLIGPDHLSAKDRERLLACKNVIIVGPKPYAEIPDLMRGFDVCIAPHLVTPFTESLNPIKLWEYLAAGKPIVSTPVAGFRDFPRLVRLADGPVEFLKATYNALSEKSELAEARRTEARKHSWDRRVDAIERVINAL
jgi:teichuronic acid biosynthesis glycosyltransferase TuaH